MNNGGYIKFIRSQNALELLKRPKSFVLLALIAQRARRTNEINVHNLSIGEALVGDYSAIGLTEQEYRTAKKFLERCGLVTFNATSRGTVAKLVSNTVFDINSESSNDQVNRQAANRQRTSNGQATTKKNVKNYKNVKNEKILKEYRKIKKTFLEKSAMPQPIDRDMIESGL